MDFAQPRLSLPTAQLSADVKQTSQWERPSQVEKAAKALGSTTRLLVSLFKHWRTDYRRSSGRNLGHFLGVQHQGRPGADKDDPNPQKRVRHLQAEMERLILLGMPKHAYQNVDDWGQAEN